MNRGGGKGATADLHEVKPANKAVIIYQPRIHVDTAAIVAQSVSQGAESGAILLAKKVIGSRVGG